MLVVEDSDFFRQLVVPILGAAAYRVTAVASAAEALRLREAGAMFDAIVSDIEMPDMDGLDFARAVRAGGAWAGPADDRAVGAQPTRTTCEAGRDAGFTDYVAKIRARGLIASLRAMPGRNRRGVIDGTIATDDDGYSGPAEWLMQLPLERPAQVPTDEEDQVFVTLTVADQLCGVPVLGVRDILGEQTITRIPLAPPEIAGSLNLRGRIVTAIDLRRRLQSAAGASRARSACRWSPNRAASSTRCWSIRSPRS